MSKLTTLCRYARFGLRAGSDLRSKLVLATALPRLKLSRAFGLKEGGVCNAEVTIGPLKRRIYFRQQDIFILYEVFGRGYVLPNMLEDPPRVILDLGAHIGLATLQFIAYFPKAFVHCYEPEPENFELLRLNTSDLPQVSIHQEAVGAESGKAELYVDPLRRAGSSLKPRKGARIAIVCPVRSLDEILADIGEVDMIKFDIEGIEWDVFSRSMRVHTVGHIVGEIKAPYEKARRFLGLFPNHEGYLLPLADRMFLVYLRKR